MIFLFQDHYLSITKRSSHLFIIMASRKLKPEPKKKAFIELYSCENNNVLKVLKALRECFTTNEHSRYLAKTEDIIRFAVLSRIIPTPTDKNDFRIELDHFSDFALVELDDKIAQIEFAPKKYTTYTECFKFASEQKELAHLMRKNNRAKEIKINTERHKAAKLADEQKHIDEEHKWSENNQKQKEHIITKYKDYIVRCVNYLYTSNQEKDTLLKSIFGEYSYSNMSEKIFEIMDKAHSKKNAELLMNYIFPCPCSESCTWKYGDTTCTHGKNIIYYVDVKEWNTMSLDATKPIGTCLIIS